MDPNALARVESLCHALYQGSDARQRAEAQTQLLALQSSVEFIPQCQYILDNSKQPYAQLLASTSLEQLITQFWNNFSGEQKVEIRNYVLNFLAKNAQGIQEFVATSVSRLVAKITKLGWFDKQELREFVEETKKFLQATIDHNLIGLRLLNALVDEMNIPTSGKTLTAHRKVAVSFRDLHLYATFQIALTTLYQLQRNSISGITTEQSKKMTTLALSLCNACLSFDFIGTNPEESAEDVGTVQVPSAWRPIVQDTAVMVLFFDMYKTSEPPRSNVAIQVLIQISSIRRTLFQTEKERATFLQALLDGIRVIMDTKRGLQHVDNYHEFCRLLGRLKASYQLSELVKVNGFVEWLELAADFTVKSLQNWQYSMNSIHYLLAMWGRLVAAVPYLPQDSQRASQALKKCCMTVVEFYVKIMLESVETVVKADGDVEDPLEDEGSLKEQMDKLPIIARLQYETFAQYLKGAFDSYFSQYNAIPTSSGGLNGSQSTAAQRQAVEVLEGRLAWIVYMTGAVVSVQSSDPHSSKADLLWDGMLSKCVFQLLSVVEYRMSNSNGQNRVNSKLEMAFLYFFQSFRRSYIVSESINNSSNIASALLPSSTTAAAHPMLAFALGSGSMAAGSSSSGRSTLEPNTIYEAMDMGDMPTVTNVLINKICTNIKFWNKSNEILELTLEIFVDFVTGYNAARTLLNLDSINFLIRNHTGVNFPFLGYDNDNKYRITFYAALSKLVFSAAEDSMNSFDVFIEPMEAIIKQLSSATDLRNNSVKIALIGLLRDLRGVLEATSNKRTYNLFFDAMFPILFPLLTRVADTWYDDETVMTALLKFMQELVYNKGQRIVFDQSSANGILLFREASKILASYGSRILSLPVKNDIYREKYKGIRLMLNVLTCAMSGNYVNFGVFALYGDKALQNSLDVSLQMCLQIPQLDVLAYIKLSKAFYGYLEVLFRNHLNVISSLDAPVFNQLIKLTHEGLQSSDLTVSTFCATTIDDLATFLFLHSNAKAAAKPVPTKIRANLAAEPTLIPTLMGTLMNQLLFASHANHWAVTRPILSLMLASETAFKDYENHLIATQSPDNRDRLREEFRKLTADTPPSVESLNRDRFTQKLTIFRLNVRQFLTL